MLCSYGCGNKGIHKLKNGKFCCEKSANSCPINKKKNSDSTKISNYFVLNPNNILKKCVYCQKDVSICGIKKHEKSCYLNPKNITHCPVCGKAIKNYKLSKTCSYACSNSYFRSEENNPNWRGRNYRVYCFRYHKKECIICGEKNIVEVHHMDGDHENIKPENLIPLCPTHHKYIHCKYKKLIINDVMKYICWFIKQKLKP